MFKTPFKATGHYVFNYKPRFYDERKERLEALIEKHESEIKGKPQGGEYESSYEISLQKNQLKADWTRLRSNANEERKANTRVAIIIALLCGIALYLLRG